MKRYHKDVYMPLWFDWNEFWGNFKEIYITDHFKQRSGDRKIFLPSIAKLKHSDVFEVYLNDNNLIEKVGLRLQGNHSLDYCYIICRGGGIITAWKCKKSNRFNKIDRSIYEQN